MKMSADQSPVNCYNVQTGRETYFTEKYEWSETSLLILLQEIAFRWCSGCPKKYSVLLNDFLQANELPNINFPELFLKLSPLSGTDVLSKEISKALANLHIKSTSSPTSSSSKLKAPTVTVSSAYNKHKWADLPPKVTDKTHTSSRSLSPLPPPSFQVYVSGANSSTPASTNHLTVTTPNSSPKRKNARCRSVSPNLQAPRLYPSNSTVKVNLGYPPENNQNYSISHTLEDKNKSTVTTNETLDYYLPNGSTDGPNIINCEKDMNTTSLEPIYNVNTVSEPELHRILEVEKVPTGKPPIIRRSSGSDFSCIVTKIPDQHKGSLVKVAVNVEPVLNQVADRTSLIIPTKVQNIDLVSTSIIERAYAKTVSIEDSDKPSSEQADIKETQENGVKSCLNLLDLLESDGEATEIPITSTISKQSTSVLVNSNSVSCQNVNSSIITKEVDLIDGNINSESTTVSDSDIPQIYKNNDNTIFSKVSLDDCEINTLQIDPINTNKDASSYESSNNNENCENNITSAVKNMPSESDPTTFSANSTLNESCINSKHCENILTSEIMDESLENQKPSKEEKVEHHSCVSASTTMSMQIDNSESKLSCSSPGWCFDNEPNISTYIVQMIY